jgi:cell wall-associated NlpC family hydrolase
VTSHLRLITLVLALAYSVAFGPGSALAGGAKAPRFRIQLFTPHLFKIHRVRAPRLDRSPLGVKAVKYARHLLGVPYRYGGDSPGSGFDCSGLVRFVYAHFGLRLPHSSYADFDLGQTVSRGSLRPGDLVFFDGVGHVGLYVGAGRFIHAPHSGTSVQITSLNDPWYRSRYDGARRIIRSGARQLLHG